MKHTIALIGATGKSGQYLVRTLLAQQFPVRLLLRHPEKLTIQHPLITIVQGDARNKNSIQELLAGSYAIINMIGQPKGDMPPFSNVTTNILAAMPEAGTQRYIGITGLSIDAPGDQKSERTASLSAMMRQMFPATIADKQQELAVLQASPVSWSLFRLPQIVQTDEQYGTVVNRHDCPGQQISTTDLAFFLSGQLYDDQYLCLAPFVASCS